MNQTPTAQLKSTGDGLTDVEKTVLNLIGKGLRNHEIAAVLSFANPATSVDTVTQYVNAIRAKLEVPTPDLRSRQ